MSEKAMPDIKTDAGVCPFFDEEKERCDPPVFGTHSCTKNSANRHWTGCHKSVEQKIREHREASP